MISWVGRSIHDNALQPPSVLLGQLRDHIADGWRLAGHAADEQAGDGQALLDALTTEHPLQPFSHTYFRQPHRPDATAGQGLFTYAHEWRAIHAPQSAKGRDSTTTPTNATSSTSGASAPTLPPMAQETPLTLKQLGAFLKDPVKAFFNTRLGVYLEREAAESPDHEPFDLDGLAHWQLQNELIGAGRRAVEASEPPMPVVDETLARLEREAGWPWALRPTHARGPRRAPGRAVRQIRRTARRLAPRPADAGTGLALAGRRRRRTGRGGLARRAARERPGETCRLLLLTSSLINQSKYNWKHWLTPWIEHLAARSPSAR